MYRYRKWDLGNEIVLIARTEHDAVTYGPNNEIQFMNIKALNEWDSRVSSSMVSVFYTHPLSIPKSNYGICKLPSSRLM